MTSGRYEVANPPSAADWLAMEEDERVEIVREAHERTGAQVGQSPNVHAAIHVVVENRLAEGHAAVVDAYDRCRAAGLDRHNAIHALASVVTRHMMAAVNDEGFDAVDADRDYENIDPEQFKPKQKGTGLSKGLFKRRR